MQLPIRARLLLLLCATAAVPVVVQFGGFIFDGDQVQFGFLLAAVALSILMLLLSAWLLERWVSRPLRSMVAVARKVEAGDEASFGDNRAGEIAELSKALETMRLRMAAQRTAMAADARQSSAINRFTDVATFVEDEQGLAGGALDALAEMTGATDAVIHIVSVAHDRAVMAGQAGDYNPGDIAVGLMDSCPGVRRGALYTTPDLERALSVHCPVYPASKGSLACVPLTAGGEVLGVAHLHWSEARTLQVAVRTAMNRVTDHAGMTIANRRLLVALRAQSLVDAHTNLMNARTFDQTLDKAMTGRRPRHEMAVLLVDVDNFAAFNDRNGTPAGDDALRFFARTLVSCLRDADVAARYGPEEFAVLLPEMKLGMALEVAERIRAKTEMTVLPVGLDADERITVSIGVAVAPQDGTTRVEMLRAADTALHEAKLAGRNRVQAASELIVEEEPSPESPEIHGHMVVIRRDLGERPAEQVKA